MVILVNINDLCENEDIEIRLILEAIYLKYGYDFREYSRAHIKRRLLYRYAISNFKSLSEMQHKIINDEKFFKSILLDFSIIVTEMYRDPEFYNSIRNNVLDKLKQHSFIKIWHAGCASGEEVYSMAILLKEEGIYEKTQIYATDFNEEVLSKAKEGIFPIECIKEYTNNYQKAGGIGSFADYYTANNDFVVIDPSLRKNIVFAHHNLVNDGVFGEMNLIVCRNVLIYFTNKLKEKVIKLFLDSLSIGGYLWLGPKESLKFSEFENQFQIVAKEERIYRKKEECGMGE